MFSDREQEDKRFWNEL